MATAAAVDEAVGSLKAALAAVAAPAGGGVPAAGGGGDVKAAAERLRAAAAKIGLMWGGGAPPSADEAASVISSLAQDAQALCAAIAAAVAGGGPTLRADAAALARACLQPAISLLSSLPSNPPAASVKQGVGAIWRVFARPRCALPPTAAHPGAPLPASARTHHTHTHTHAHAAGCRSGCDAVGRAYLDDRRCLFRHLATVHTVLADTLREMAELGAHAAQAADSGSGGGGMDGDGDSEGRGGGGGASGSDSEEGGGDGYDAGPLSPEEAQILGMTTALLTPAAGVVHALSRALLAAPWVEGEEGTQAWESTLFHAKAMQRAFEDAGALLYPPIDTRELSAAAAAIANCADVLAEEAPAEGLPPGTAEAVAALAAAAEAAAAALADRLRQLQ